MRLRTHVENADDVETGVGLWCEALQGAACGGHRIGVDVHPHYPCGPHADGGERVQTRAAANVQERKAVEALAATQALQVGNGLGNLGFVDLLGVVEPVFTKGEVAFRGQQVGVGHGVAPGCSVTERRCCAANASYSIATCALGVSVTDLFCMNFELLSVGTVRRWALASSSMVMLPESFAYSTRPARAARPRSGGIAAGGW